MRWSASSLYAAALLAGSALPAAADTRLVVFEAQDCAACVAFRSDVLPAYWGEASARPVPMTLVDVDALGTGGFSPSRRIETLPTIVLFEDGRERGRIAGPVARQELDSLIDRLHALRQQ